MSIACPYCQHPIALRSTAVGRFKANCPSCGLPFAVTVPADPTLPPTAAPLAPTSAPSITAPPRRPIAAATTAPPHPARTATSQQPASHAAPPAPRAVHAPTPSDPASPAPTSGDLTGSRLGGYELLARLGQGAMGTVYLARQLSLDRNVALKVLAPTLAADPEFVVRFTREAYAAAQLNHHNVVQIHDIGVELDTSDGPTNFFSMELVEGQTLARLMHECGRVDPEVAVGYALQAARGLAFAHAHGLIHRDIKPDNLLLGEQGIVKVADLGLVKRAGQKETTPLSRQSAAPLATQLHAAMGTPAYMPPEQAQNAAAVDARADIYALGCTLYDLLTGRPPFVGRTAAEVITKHATEPVVPPDRLAHHVSKDLSVVVMKMIAKRPVNRYQSMTEVVAALEQWLGVSGDQPFSPRQEHVDRLEAAAKQFHSSRWAARRRRLIVAFLAVSAAAILLTALPTAVRFWLPPSVACFAALSLLIYGLIFGIAQHTMLAGKIRQLAFDARPLDWLRLALLLAVLGFLLAAFGLQYLALAAALAAAVVAAMFYTYVDRPLLVERREPLAQIEQLLREMRLRGLDEPAVRQFVWKYAGEHWEQLHELLFGYPAKLEARQWEVRRAAGRVGPQGRRRPTFGRWRDPLVAAIDRTLARRQRQRQERVLAEIQTRALEARGMEQPTARRAAEVSTRRLMQRAEHIRQSAAQFCAAAAATAPPPQSAPAPHRRTSPPAGATTDAIPTDWMHDGESPDQDHWPARQHQSYLRRRYGTPLDVLLGSGVRFILALVILAGFALWWDRNAGQNARNQAAALLAHREDAAATVQNMSHKGAVAAVHVFQNFSPASTATLPLRIPRMPDWLCDAVGSWRGGLAGALLLLSIFFRGRLLSLTVFAAAALCLFGTRIPWPAATPLPAPAASVVLGVAVWVLGMLFLRRIDLE